MAALTFAEKALARAAGVAEAQAGDILIVRPDRILSHDNTAAIAHIFHDELEAKRVADPERLCVVLDHASPPVGVAEKAELFDRVGANSSRRRASGISSKLGAEFATR